MLLNFFDNVLDKIYYSTRRPIGNSNMSAALVITLISFTLAILCFVKVIRKKDDKKPIAWGWLILSLFMLAITVVYSIQAVKSL